MIVIVALIVTVIVTIALTFGKFARSDSWRATITPLASIIGSGFLICGPLLAREFGSAALGAMAVLLAIAYAAGAVIRFNIIHVEHHLATARFNDPVAWLARVTQGVLALAYAVSVAYYLKLLAEFSLKPVTIDPASQPMAANIIVTVLIALMTLLALGGSLRKVEHLAHGTVSIKIGIIAGLLAALGISCCSSPCKGSRHRDISVTPIQPSCGSGRCAMRSGFRQPFISPSSRC
jgi:fumarate reductase subunit D